MSSEVKAVVEVINVPAWQPTGEKIDLSEGDEAKAPDSAKEEPATDVEGASTELEKLLDEVCFVSLFLRSVADVKRRGDVLPSIGPLGSSFCWKP